MQTSKTPSSRRGFVTGTMTVGAAAAAAVALPRVPPEPQAASPARPKPERGGGYSLSEHVKRYYKTTLI
ncbi:MAG: twin-arginine translocation signal domain-containing protein [Burkholderiales bacterium]